MRAGHQKSFLLAQFLQLRFEAHEQLGRQRGASSQIHSASGAPEDIRVAWKCAGTAQRRSAVLSGVGGDPLEPFPSVPEPRPKASEARVDSQLPFKEAKEQQVETFTKDYLASLLEKHKGNLSAVARAAGLNRNYVRELVFRYGLKIRSS